MVSQLGKYLGILDLDCGSPADVKSPLPPKGSLLRSDTFDLPVITEVVEGAWADAVMRGDPELEPAYVAAARRLVERGAVVISSNCGGAIRYQAALAAAVDVPVITSGMFLLPLLLRQLPSTKKIGILTLNSKAFTDDLLGLDDLSQRERIVIGGVEGGEFAENESASPPRATDLLVMEREVAECATRLRSAHPDIGAFLFSCTLFPPVAPMVRRTTRLPVYDIATVCRMILQSIPI
ncbi:hypothetical protein EVC45_39985 [Paraburkholderia sp. UYCP14C]|uniref:hypothetical protein n=1 Tax=Paraburkholderia sp. UYCP14C TaxID=2511130 RepID=UPI00101F98F8|nr:hypothetical protein [Paraburkholderia sp. UYCP14C]RZF24219.1 hypothetical protein EVC45_39985 [Paraburkholderia sp. UYCP14C]